MKDKRYKVAIIGCGKIAGFLDGPGDKRVLTHAHAYKSLKDFRVTACCDKDSVAGNKFISRWGGGMKLYRDCGELFSREDVSVLSICADTKNHAGLLLKALKAKGVKVIICEKPLVSNMKEFKKVAEAINSHPEKRVVINYSRRYDPSFKIVENIIKSGTLGSPISFSSVFNKGFYHNGCHVIELVTRFFGQIKEVNVVEKRPVAKELFVNLHLRTKICSGDISNLTDAKYSTIEMNIYFTKGKICITELGHRIEMFRRTRSARYDGYYELIPYCVLEDTLLFSAAHLMRYVLGLLKSGRRDDKKLLKEHLDLSEKMIKINDGILLGRKKILFR